MCRLLGVIALVVTVRSATAYDYFDSNAKATAEKIESTPLNLNQLLSLGKYTCSAKLQEALQWYAKAAAKVEGKSCAVDGNKFDNSFKELVEECKTKAASQKNKEALTEGISKAISEIQMIDQSLKLSSKLFHPSSPSSSSPGQVAKTKALESLKAVQTKFSTLMQDLFHATKSAMDACVAAESEKLWGKIIDAAKAVRSC